MIESDFKPLAAYVSSKTRWESECQRCFRTVFLTLANLQTGFSGYVYCSKRKIDVKEVLKLMEVNQIKALELKPTNIGKGWKCKCLRCNRQINVYLSNLYRGSDLCKYCSGKAVDPKTAIKVMTKAKLKPLEPYFPKNINGSANAQSVKRLFIPCMPP